MGGSSRQKWNPPRELARRPVEIVREREHHGDLGPDEHPGGQLEDERLLQLELVEPLEQLRLEQHHLKPGPLELQPSVPELLLLLVHGGLQPLVQPLPSFSRMTELSASTRRKRTSSWS